jgi:hypothetical protein
VAKEAPVIGCEALGKWSGRTRPRSAVLELSTLRPEFRASTALGLDSEVVDEHQEHVFEGDTPRGDVLLAEVRPSRRARPHVQTSQIAMTSPKTYATDLPRRVRDSVDVLVAEAIHDPLIRPKASPTTESDAGSY